MRTTSARGADEGPAGLRPQGDLPRPLCGVAQYAEGAPFVAENPSRRCKGLRDLRPYRLRGGRPVQRVREPVDRRRSPGRHARLRLRPARRDRSGPGRRLRRRPSARSSPAAREAVRGGDLRRRGRPVGREDQHPPADLRRAGRRRARVRRDGGRRRDGRRPPQGALRGGSARSSRPCRWRSRRSVTPRARPRNGWCRSATSRPPSSTAAAPGRASSPGSARPGWRCCSASATDHRRRRPRTTLRPPSRTASRGSHPGDDDTGAEPPVAPPG